jgi:hypothetical protein
MVFESLIEEHDDGFVVDLQNDVSLIAEALNKLPEGLSLFCTMLVRSQSTLGHTHVAQKLLMNCWHMSDHECTNPMGSPKSHVLADDDKQIGK